MELATFGAGCFWCIESAFNQVRGVSALSGYMGGHTASPNYRSVCSGTTGHAEVVQLQFDPSVISYDLLLQIFWFLHDPTTLNRQGNDVGTQYRSVVFYHDESQLQQAQQSKAAQQLQWSAPIVTELSPASTFYPAEDYHQGYFEQNPQQPYCSILIAPKLAKFRQHFAALLK
ncbi:peptide-methionine (S)-S-oxide reductase MsrA [Rheinheimera sp.]|uniref:peptide-methionine (S)-S-oxide reductase MsrA n=1 Tax=Rheinheimera sp. TaxID=1869214 RepID=UPI00307EC9C8